jgi:hypothetical protein
MASPSPLNKIHLEFSVANLRRSVFGKNNEAPTREKKAMARLKIMNKKGLGEAVTFLEASTNIALPTAAKNAKEKELVNKFFKGSKVRRLISVIHAQ